MRVSSLARWTGRPTSSTTRPEYVGPPRLRGHGRGLAALGQGDVLVKAVVESSVRALGQTGDRAEEKIIAWFNRIADLAEKRVATCEQIKAFNRASLRLYDAQVRLFLALVKAGVEGVEPPPTPPLIAKSVSTGNMVGQVSVDDGCSGKVPDWEGGVRPIYGRAGLSKTYQGGLGIAAVAAAPWIGRAVIAAVVAIGAIFILIELRKLFTSEEVDRIRKEFLAIEASRDDQRVALYAQCIGAGGDPGTCAREVRDVLPPGTPPEGQSFLGGLGKLMTIGIIGGIALIVIPKLVER